MEEEELDEYGNPIRPRTPTPGGVPTQGSPGVGVPPAEPTTEQNAAEFQKMISGILPGATPGDGAVADTRISVNSKLQEFENEFRPYESGELSLSGLSPQEQVQNAAWTRQDLESWKQQAANDPAFASRLDEAIEKMRAAEAASGNTWVPAAKHQYLKAFLEDPNYQAGGGAGAGNSYQFQGLDTQSIQNVAGQAQGLKGEGDQSRAAGHNILGDAYNRGPTSIDHESRYQAEWETQQRELMDRLLSGMDGGSGLGESMLRESAARQASAQEQAGVSAATAYGMSQGQAREEFERARLAQEQATRDANIDAVRRIATLIAGARGGNIGAALLQGQNAAASQTAEAGRSISQQAAQAQIQADAQRHQQNLRVSELHEQAGIRAAEALAVGDERAYQAAKNEEQFYAQQATQLATQARGQDIQQDTQSNQLAFEAAVQNGNYEEADKVMAAQIGQFLVDSGMNLSQAALDDIANLINIQTNYSMNMNQLQVSMRNADLSYAASVYATQSGNQQAQNQMIANIVVAGLAAAATGAAAGAGGGGLAPSSPVENPNAGVGQAYSNASNADYSTITSDERAKKIKGKKDDHDFRRATSYEYEYDEDHKDDPRAGPGMYVGPMAQDLPESVISQEGTTTSWDGSEEVEEDVLRVDIGRLALSLACAVGEIQNKLDELPEEEPEEYEDEDTEPEEMMSPELILKLIFGGGDDARA